MKGFLQRILQEIMKKDNTWNIRRLVDETIDPAYYIEDGWILNISGPINDTSNLIQYIESKYRSMSLVLAY